MPLFHFIVASAQVNAVEQQCCPKDWLNERTGRNKLLCRAARVRKLEATKAKRATKRELIVVATMISRMIGTSVFSDRTEFSVVTMSLILKPFASAIIFGNDSA